MTRGMESQEDNVVLLILTQLSRVVLDDDLALLVIQRDMVNPVLSRLSSDLVVATEVINWAVLLAETPAGLPALCEGKSVALLQTLSDKSSTIQMRVLDLIVKIAIIDEHHLDSVRKTGFLDILVKAIHNDDFLLKLNCISTD